MVPCLDNPPAPDMPPANVVLVLSNPVVNTVPVPSTKLPPVEPPPAMEPRLKLLLSCNIAPLTLLKVTADLSPKALACEVMTLPPVMAVLPVKALLPLNVSVPPEALIDKPPVPEIRPESVAAGAFNVSVLDPEVKVCKV